MTSTRDSLDCGRRTRFSDDLEEQAHALISTPVDDQSPILESFAREIALTLQQIAEVRRLSQEQNHRLLEIGCYYTTDLQVLEDLGLPTTCPEALSLRKELQRLERDRQELARKTQQALRSLHDRLLELVNRHLELSQIDNGNGNGNDRPKA